MAWRVFSFGAGVCAYGAVALGVVGSDAPELVLFFAHLGALFIGVTVWSYAGSLPPKYRRLRSSEPAATRQASDQHR